jgi:hypothetical protein
VTPPRHSLTEPARIGHVIPASVVCASPSCCFAAGRSGHGSAYLRSLSHHGAVPLARRLPAGAVDGPISASPSPSPTRGDIPAGAPGREARR